MLKYIVCLIAISSTLFATPKTYIIYREAPGAGFWSNFFVILSGIEEADSKGITPVVDMKRYRTYYNEKKKIHKTFNAWEYYFEQPGGISLESALNGPYECKSLEPFSIANAIQPSEDQIQRGKDLINRYIKVKEHILDEANRIIPNELHTNILGIHISGMARRKGLVNNLLIDADESYLKKAKELDEEHHFSKIFLACDTLETVKLFKKEFGDRLLATKAYRVSKKLPIYRGYGWLFNTCRKNHRYLLGKEALIDALLLSRCEHFICGPSNTAHAAMYFSSGQQIHEIAFPRIEPR